MRLVCGSLALCFLLPACADGPRTEMVGSQSSGQMESPDASTGGGVDVGDSSSSTGGASGPGPRLCTEEASSLIYLLGEGTVDEGLPTGSLHRLEPDTLAVTDLGALDCGAAPRAMTLSQDGVLWSSMFDPDVGEIVVTIDPQTLECSRTAFVAPPRVGMQALAFVGTVDGGERLVTGSLPNEALEGTDYASFPLELNELNLDTIELQRLGKLPVVPNEYYQLADLVGTGDGRLLGFYTNAAHIVEIDVEGVAFEHVLPVALETGSPWAFTQWEGRAWLVTGGSDGSNLHAVDLDTGRLEQLSGGLGVSVVGAAASVCAPFLPEG